MSDLIGRLHKTLDHEVEVLQHQFMRNGVRSLKATAKFLNANAVSLTTDDGAVSELPFEHALISVGTRPHRPDTIPFDGKRIFDSDNILELEHLPRSLTVVGGGVIGVEYATIFSALDVPVTLIEPRNTILDFVDRELVDDFIHQLRDRGMTIRLGASAKEIRALPNGVETLLSDGRMVRTDILLYAAGRSGNLGSLGLEAVGIEPDSRGRIKVDPPHLPDFGAQYLRDRGCDRFSEPRLDVDGAGPCRRLSRLRGFAATTTRNVSLWNLCRSGNLHGRSF